MAAYSVYARVAGEKYLGTYEAETAHEAIAMVDLEDVCLCRDCLPLNVNDVYIGAAYAEEVNSGSSK